MSPRVPSLASTLLFPYYCPQLQAAAPERTIQDAWSGALAPGVASTTAAICLLDLPK